MEENPRNRKLNDCRDSDKYNSQCDHRQATNLEKNKPYNTLVLVNLVIKMVMYIFNVSGAFIYIRVAKNYF